MKHNLYSLEADDDPCPDRPATIVTGIDESKFYPQEGECPYEFDEEVISRLTHLVQQAMNRTDISAYAVLGKTIDPGFYIGFGPIGGRMPSLRGQYIAPAPEQDPRYARPRKKQSWEIFDDVETAEELRILLLCVAATGLALRQTDPT